MEIVNSTLCLIDYNIAVFDTNITMLNSDLEEFRSINLTKYPVNNELNDICFSIYKENTILKDEIYALKLQASEYESIGKFSI
jgi:hypothetical protein